MGWIYLTGSLIFWWFGSCKCLGLHTWWSTKNKEMTYTPMGGSSAINAMVYAHFGGTPKTKV